MADFQLHHDEDYSRYKNDTIESQGFYVSNDCGAEVPFGVVRINKENVVRYQKAGIAAEYAVGNYNIGKSNKLFYLGITNLNMAPTAGFFYYITLKAKDSCGHICHYHVKVWEKINTGYQVQIFRLAPFSSSPEGNMTEEYCVMVKSLLPWMDENYLYYSCFFRERRGIVDIKVKQENGECIAYLCFKSGAEEVVKNYNGAAMPYSKQCYNLILRKD